MGVKLLHPMPRQRSGQPGIDFFGPGSVLCRPGRNGAPCGHIFHKALAGPELFQQLRQIHGASLLTFPFIIPFLASLGKTDRLKESGNWETAEQGRDKTA